MSKIRFVVLAMVAALTMFVGVAWADEPVFSEDIFVESTDFNRVDLYLGYYGTLDSQDSASGDAGWAQGRLWLTRYQTDSGLEIDPGLYVKATVSSGDYSHDGYITDAETESFGFGGSLQVSRARKYVLTADLGYEYVCKETAKDKEFGTFSSEQEDGLLDVYVHYADFRRRAMGKRWLPKTVLEFTGKYSLSEDYSGYWNGGEIVGLDGFDPGKTEVLLRPYLRDLGGEHRLTPAFNLGYTWYAESDRENCAEVGASLAYSYLGHEFVRVDYLKKLGDDEATALAVTMSLSF